MPLIIPANSITGGYEVDNSLRFNDGSSDYLSRTPSSASNRKTWTFSAWFKLSSGGGNTIFSSYTDGNNWTDFYFSGTNKFEFVSYASGYLINFTSSQIFRDYSAWTHIVLAFDTTQSTASDRIKLYVNGSQVTALDNNTYPTQNSDHKINSTDQHRLGLSQTNAAISYDGYMAEVCFIDGSQLDPTSFGEFDEDSGIWKPIDVSGLTFGTNGFYLDFENSGSLGNDKSGNGNNFTVNNLTSIDQTTDTPTNNFATLNPLSTKATLSEGNTVSAHDGSATSYLNSVTTLGMTSGKWYCECKVTVSGSFYPGIGIGSTDASILQNKFSDSYLGETSDTYGFYASDDIYNNGSIIANVTTFATNDIISMALDLDSAQNTLKYYKNGSLIHTINLPDNSSGWFFGSVQNNLNTSARAKFNFGNPSFTISSGNSDGNGFGNFEYAPPTNYFSLCSSNLAEYG